MPAREGGHFFVTSSIAKPRTFANEKLQQPKQKYERTS